MTKVREVPGFFYNTNKFCLLLTPTAPSSPNHKQKLTPKQNDSEKCIYFTMRNTQSGYSTLNIQWSLPMAAAMLHDWNGACYSPVEIVVYTTISPPTPPLYSCRHKMEGGMRTKVNVSYCCLNLPASAGVHRSVPQETVRRASSQPEAPLGTSSQGSACPCETSGLPANSRVTFIKHSPAMADF